MTINIVSSPDYFDIAELLAPYVTDARDLLRLSNSVADKTNEVVRREVDEALDEAEAPFRRIMDEQSREINSLHQEVADLREQLAVRQAVSAANLRSETTRGIDYALGSGEVMGHLDQPQGCQGRCGVLHGTAAPRHALLVLRLPRVAVTHTRYRPPSPGRYPRGELAVDSLP